MSTGAEWLIFLRFVANALFDLSVPLVLGVGAAFGVAFLLHRGYTLAKWSNTLHRIPSPGVRTAVTVAIGGVLACAGIALVPVTGIATYALASGHVIVTSAEWDTPDHLNLTFILQDLGAWRHGLLIETMYDPSDHQCRMADDAYKVELLPFVPHRVHCHFDQPPGEILTIATNEGPFPPTYWTICLTPGQCDTWGKEFAARLPGEPTFTPEWAFSGGCTAHAPENVNLTSTGLDWAPYFAEHNFTNAHAYLNTNNNGTWCAFTILSDQGSCTVQWDDTCKPVCLALADGTCKPPEASP